jgi:hypothetical protein
MGLGGPRQSGVQAQWRMQVQTLPAGKFDVGSVCVRVCRSHVRAAVPES